MLHTLQDVQPEHTQMDKLKGMLRLAFLFIFEGSVELGEGTNKKVFSKWTPLRKFIVSTLKEAHGIVDAREATDKKEDNVSPKLCEDELDQATLNMLHAAHHDMAKQLALQAKSAVVNKVQAFMNENPIDGDLDSIKEVLEFHQAFSSMKTKLRRLSKGNGPDGLRQRLLADLVVLPEPMQVFFERVAKLITELVEERMPFELVKFSSRVHEFACIVQSTDDVGSTESRTLADILGKISPTLAQLGHLWKDLADLERFLVVRTQYVCGLISEVVPFLEREKSADEATSIIQALPEVLRRVVATLEESMMKIAAHEEQCGTPDGLAKFWSDVLCLFNNTPKGGQALHHDAEYWKKHAFASNLKFSSLTVDKLRKYVMDNQSSMTDATKAGDRCHACCVLLPPACLPSQGTRTYRTAEMRSQVTVRRATEAGET
jgi:hypothetical protein